MSEWLTQAQLRLWRELREVGAFLDITQSVDGAGFPLRNSQEFSPFYITLRTGEHPRRPGPITRQLLECIANEYVHVLQLSPFGTIQHVAGVPYTSTQIAQLVAEKMGLGHIVIHKFSRTASSCLIEGTFKPDDSVLVIEDTLSSGQSAVGNAALLSRAGLSVRGILAFIDRSSRMPGDTSLEGSDVSVRAIFSIWTILRMYEQFGDISPDMYAQAIEFLTHTGRYRSAI